LTSSFGVAELQKGEDVSHLIKRGDQALYAAKKSGRDRVVVSTH
jgi:PleD family two-component response regulator